MPFYVTLDALIEYAPTPSEYSELQQHDDESDTLEDLLGGKVKRLADILGQIQHEVRQRGLLCEDVIQRIYLHYSYLKSKLMELYVWPLSGNRAIEQRRNGLEKQLDALKQEKRQEQVKCWQDIAVLKVESRTWQKQYHDLVQRVRLVLGRGKWDCPP